MTKQLWCGDVPIGGGAPVTVQSMTNTDTRDVAATVAQIERLAEAGCQLVRVAVPDSQAAQAIAQIRRQINIPLIADIHFDHRLAVQAIEQGADKIRINPGNIGGPAGLQKVVAAARRQGVPIRVGVNSGSLDADLLKKHGGVTAAALAESALRMAGLIENLGYDQLVLSIKSPDPKTCYDACRRLADQSDHPQHIGVTEAGSIRFGSIRSAVGIGALLLAGIGDTLRVSLTGDPVEEVRVGIDILKAAGLRREGIDVVSCPTCGRTWPGFHASIADLESQIAEIAGERRRQGLPPIRAAIMGCEVNGPGEARQADIGIAFGNQRAVLFRKNSVSESGEVENIVRRFLEELRTL
ncbi:MAG TPA: flavodoxin-dependent (E)-4-hydroxy-3-methylbut-2-enyl-diphosphate synthase [Clostridiales bacterium]|jgi:(E)-4-hydroxy-3-methylbut-2-enyl-diphosphate synthase|nr:flavodoxin-dependent (E)-4-hydroxy-3-methylbut-2-enyl-diphosphate synthase [Clostridiales bacterium]